MKLLCLTGFLAAASAFTVTPTSFTTQTYSVGEKGAVNFGDNAVSHRTRRATVVMDGKANGTSYGEVLLISETIGFQLLLIQDSLLLSSNHVCTDAFISY